MTGRARASRHGVRTIIKAILTGASLFAIAAAAPANSSSGTTSEASAPQLVPMDPLTVPIVGSARMEGALRLKLVLAAKDEHGLAQLTEELPQLRAATVASAIEFARLYASAQTPVDAVQLSKDLTRDLRKHNSDVASVLIVEVSTTA